jgi:hypothetical protein
MGEKKTKRLRLPVVLAGSLLLAVAIVVLAVGNASGVETVPENTVAPTITPISPVVEGKTETAAEGSWNGSPTSFTYSWYRCSGSEACVSIPFATSKTYVPTASDVGHTLRVAVVASNGKGSASAISAATSAAVGPPSFYWNSCKKTGAGVYTDSACTVKGAGGFEWTKLAETSPVSFSAAGSTSFKLATTIIATVRITCTAQSAEGTLENPSGAKPGTVPSTSFKLSGCAVLEPKSCTTPATITTNLLQGKAIEFEGGPAVKFEPIGTSIFIVTLKGETCAIAGEYPVKGTFFGIDGPSTSSLEFTKKSTEGMILFTKPVSLEGTTKLQTAAGESLKLAP